MADSKISALTASTTPLTGTEVLPIVQGGVTKKVSIANLTAGRVVNMLRCLVDGAYDGSAPSTSSVPVARINEGGALSLWISGQAYNNVWLQAIQDDGSNNLKPLYLQPLGGSVYTGANIVPQVAGQGIDFTANTGTVGKTSTLLNWYEEGTWTPNQGAGLTVVGAFSSSGTYTRVGRQITVRGSVSGATSVALAATASQICTNLPYSCNGGHSGTMFNSALSVSGGVAASAAILYALTTIAATPTITFTITYQI